MMPIISVLTILRDPIFAYNFHRKKKTLKLYLIQLELISVFNFIFVIYAGTIANINEGSGLAILRSPQFKLSRPLELQIEVNFSNF